MGSCAEMLPGASWGTLPWKSLLSSVVGAQVLFSVAGTISAVFQYKA